MVIIKLNVMNSHKYSVFLLLFELISISNWIQAPSAHVSIRQKLDNCGLFYIYFIYPFSYNTSIIVYNITDILCAFISFTLIIIIAMNLKQLGLRHVLLPSRKIRLDDWLRKLSKNSLPITCCWLRV